MKNMEEEVAVAVEDNGESKKQDVLSIGDRMKAYEKAARSFIDPSLPAIMRIDGHAFSKFTGGLKKPYDEWLHRLM